MIKKRGKRKNIYGRDLKAMVLYSSANKQPTNQQFTPFHPIPSQPSPVRAKIIIGNEGRQNKQI